MNAYIIYYETRDYNSCGNEYVEECVEKPALEYGCFTDFSKIKELVKKLNKSTDDIHYSIRILKLNEEEQFKITGTGFYKTRDERKVYIATVTNFAFGIVDGNTESYIWSLDGEVISETPILNANDIVSKWEK